ncbi:hypothetical protein [Streptomyces antibioticus]|uniref:hypothetical protein n=1 Tax=Streptomyces antibioticus TaxID=1890 RepID=UPI003D725D41
MGDGGRVGGELWWGRYDWSRFYEPDEPDVSLGMGTYCLVSGGRTHYGGLLRVEREGHVLRFDIAGRAAAVLNVPERVTVRFDAPAENVEAYMTGLPSILDWGRAEERPVLVGFSRRYCKPG